MATIVRDVYTHSGIAPMPITINSLFANEMGFRLSFEILNSDDDVVYSASLSPSNTGDMDIDLLPILKYYVSPHEFNHIGGIADASSEVFKYKYRTTESYIQSSVATEWYFRQPYASQNKTVLEFSAGHHFTNADIGKYININVSNVYPDGSPQQNISGKWILTNILDGFEIAISLPFHLIGSGVGLDATVYLADQTRVTLASTTSSFKYLYNYELSYYQKMNCDTEDNNLLSFLTTSGSVKLLSSHIYPASRDLYPFQNEYVTILDPNTYVNKIRFTSDNCVLEKTIGVFQYKSVKISNIFEDEYTLMSGNLPLIDCNTRSYQVDFLDGAGDVMNIDYLDNCATMFKIGSYDCISAIEEEDGRIVIDIDVPSGTIVSVAQPFTLSLDEVTFSNSVEVTNESILYVNINTDVGEYMETITFKNGWKMECRCICATVDYSDEIVVDFDDVWDGNIAVVAEGGSFPLPAVKPWKSRNATDDIIFSVSGPYIQISLDGLNYSDTVIAPPSMTIGNLYIIVNDISETHIDTLVITSDDMNTVTYPIQSEVIETVITLSPDNITFVDVEESQPSQKIEVTFNKNNNNGITTFTVSGNYLISNTIDGVYSSSITSNLQNGNIYVKMNDTMTTGIFTGTISATSLSGVDTASLSGEVVIVPVYEAKVAAMGKNTDNDYPIVFSVSDVNDLNSGVVSIVDTSPYTTNIRSLRNINSKWFLDADRNVYISEDTITWTKVMDVNDLSNPNDRIDNIYYINNEYVMYIRSTSGTSNNCFKSSDGITWTGSNIHNDTIHTTTFDGGKIVIVYDDSVRISIDNGATWTTRTNPNSSIYDMSRVKVVGDTIFMHTSRYLYKSLDNGTTWGTVDTLDNGAMVLSGSRLLPNNQFIVTARNKIYVTNSSMGNTSWTTVNIPNSSGWTNISSNGTNVVLVGALRRISITSDLTATTGWSTPVTSNIGFDIHVYDGDYYSANGDGELVKSSDGITWTAFITSPNIIVDNRPIASI